MKKIIKYIFRGWNNEPKHTHPKLKIFPPIFFDVMAFFLAMAILISMFKWLLNYFKTQL
jgi:hypothetical protein